MGRIHSHPGPHAAHGPWVGHPCARHLEQDLTLEILPWALRSYHRVALTALRQWGVLCLQSHHSQTRYCRRRDLDVWPADKVSNPRRKLGLHFLERRIHDDLRALWPSQSESRGDCLKTWNHAFAPLTNLWLVSATHRPLARC